MTQTFRIPGAVFDWLPNIAKARNDGAASDDLLVFREERGRGTSVLVTARTRFSIEQVLNELASAASARIVDTGADRNTARQAGIVYSTAVEQVRNAGYDIKSSRRNRITTHAIS